MKAVINFGHGPKNVGYDPGAIGPTGYQEATQNREVGELVASKLNRNGWDIPTIQDGDLWDVTNFANDHKPDAFLSIHANSVADPSAHGIETIILGRGGMAEKIANEIQKELVLATGLADRGVKVSNLHVLRETIGYPAVLVEIGFISNPKEEALMKQDSWDELVASAICRGFSRGLGAAYSEEEGGDDVLDVAILKYSAEDEWAAKDIDAKLGGVANFTRQGTAKVIPAAALSAKKLIIVGGPDVLAHSNRVYLSGNTKYDTAQVVGKYLG